MPIVVCAGIDVGKAELVVLVLDSRESGASRVFPNDSQGISALIEFLSRTQVARVALEPTSTYHLPVLHALLAQGGYEVYLVDPIQVANFRKLTKTKNKTWQSAKTKPELVRRFRGCQDLGSLGQGTLRGHKGSYQSPRPAPS